MESPNIPAALATMGKGNAKNKLKIVREEGDQFYVYYDTDQPNEEVFFIFENAELEKELKKSTATAVKTALDGLSKKKLDDLLDRKIHKKKGVILTSKREKVPVGTAKVPVT